MGTRIAIWLRHRIGWLVVAAVAALAAVSPPAALERIDLLLYDAIEPLAASPAHLPAPEAAIVAINEASLATLGRWPWHRSVHADLIDRLTDARVAVIGMAMLFPEPAAGDDALAQAMERSGRIVLAVAPRPAPQTGVGLQDLLPAPELAAHAAAVGHVDVELDSDALARRTFHRAGVATPTWEALSVAVASLHRQHADARGISAEAATAALMPATLRWVREGEMLLPYPDHRFAPPTFSYFNVLNDPATAARLKGKVVFVGATASGLDAGLATPNSANGTLMPAVEFHARAFEALRSAQVYHTADSGTILLFTLLALTLPLALHAPLRRWWAVVGAGLVLVPMLVSGVVLNMALLWVPPTAAIAGLAACHILWLATTLQRARGSLTHAQHHADATLQSIADGVVTIDEAGRIVFMNPVAERLTGMDLARARGQAASPFIASCCADAQPIGDMLSACLADREPRRLPQPTRWTRPDGAQLALQLTVAPIGRRGEGAVLALHDMTETLAITSRLEHEATHDPLTGLPNRTLLLDRLEQALAHARRSGSIVAVLFVDLDRFKRINDSLGHHWGDHVLKVAAERLCASVRSDDTVGRWGGDEFIVLLHNVTDRSAVATVAGKIIEQLDREVEGVDGTSLLLSCSIGISIGPHDSGDADTLLSMADKAMYRSKTEGGSSFHFYSAAMNTWSRERLGMESDLRRALGNGEFELFYQPQVDIAAQRVVGLESLIRWRKPGAGLIRPDTFIPAAEESGVIRSIGEWAIHEAASQAARWIADGLPAVPLAVNVSARQCADMNIVDTIRDALNDSRIAPSLLKIELTESTAMHNVDFVATLLDSVHRLGVGVAVDDFGTGYSSLSCLKRFPINELKIDKSFVGEIAADGDDAAIVRGTIALAHGLGMTVVAEGVETEAQLHFLAGHGCDVAQGYFFAEPLPERELRRWLVTPLRQLARSSA